MTLNKIQLIKSLAKVLSTRKEARDAVETVFKQIKISLKNGDKALISGFGSFNSFITKSKRVRNPKTGQMLNISPRRKIRFRPSKDFFGNP